MTRLAVFISLWAAVCFAEAPQPAPVAPAPAALPGPVAPAVAAPAGAAPSASAAPSAAADPTLRAAPPTLAESTPSELNKAEPDLEEMSMGWTLLRTIIVLGVVVMSIYISLNWGMRRLMGIKGPIGSGSLVSVLERVPLDQKRSLFVVKAGSEYLLLGGTDGSLSLLSKLDTAEVEKLRAERPAPSLTISPFLQKLLTRRGPRT